MIVFNLNVKVNDCAEATHISDSDKTTNGRDKSLFCLNDGKFQVLSELVEKTFARSQYQLA